MEKYEPMGISPRELKEKLDAGESVQLIDVREPQEYAICRIEGGELIPLATVPREVARIREMAAAGSVIIYCHHGIRSMQAAGWLRHQGVAGCRSLEGGIDRWSVLIDSTVPRY